MGISCYCDDDYDWFFQVEEPERVAMTDFRCYGCSEHKPAGERVRRLWKYHMETEEELVKDGDDPDDWYTDEEEVEVIDGCERLCETCSGLYDSLIALGFCLTADNGFIKDAHAVYVEEYLPYNHRVKK